MKNKTYFQIILIFFVLILLLIALTGCGGSSGNNNEETKNSKNDLNIKTQPLYQVLIEPNETFYWLEDGASALSITETDQSISILISEINSKIVNNFQINFSSEVVSLKDSKNYLLNFSLKSQDEKECSKEFYLEIYQTNKESGFLEVLGDPIEFRNKNINVWDAKHKICNITIEIPVRELKKVLKNNNIKENSFEVLFAKIKKNKLFRKDPVIGYTFIFTVNTNNANTYFNVVSNISETFYWYLNTSTLLDFIANKIKDTKKWTAYVLLKMVKPLFILAGSGNVIGFTEELIEEMNNPNSSNYVIIRKLSQDIAENTIESFIKNGGKILKTTEGFVYIVDKVSKNDLKNEDILIGGSIIASSFVEGKFQPVLSSLIEILKLNGDDRENLARNFAKGALSIATCYGVTENLKKLNILTKKIFTDIYTNLPKSDLCSLHKNHQLPPIFTGKGYLYKENYEIHYGNIYNTKSKVFSILFGIPYNGKDNNYECWDCISYAHIFTGDLLNSCTAVTYNEKKILQEAVENFALNLFGNIFGTAESLINPSYPANLQITPDQYFINSLTSEGYNITDNPATEMICALRKPSCRSFVFKLRKKVENIFKLQSSVLKKTCFSETSSENKPPIVISKPEYINIKQGEIATLKVIAKDPENKGVNIKWLENNKVLKVCNSNSCTISVSPNKTTTYLVIVEDLDGLTTTANVTVNVEVPKSILDVDASITPKEVTIKEGETATIQLRLSTIAQNVNNLKCYYEYKDKKYSINCNGSSLIEISDKEEGENILKVYAEGNKPDGSSIRSQKRLSFFINVIHKKYILTLLSENYKNGITLNANDDISVINKKWTLKMTDTHSATLLLEKDTSKNCTLNIKDLPLSISVSEGQIFDINILVEKPKSAGDFECYFKIKDENGKYYKIGDNNNLFVKVKVTANNLVVSANTNTKLVNPNESVYLSIYIHNGNPPYSLRIDWGDGNSNEYTINDKSLIYSHTYKEVGNYQISVSIVDKVDKLYENNINILVSNQITKTNWYGKVDINEDVTKSIFVNINVADEFMYNGEISHIYDLDYTPPSNKIFYYGYYLPIPEGILDLNKGKVKFTFITKTGGLEYYDREFWISTESKQFIIVPINEEFHLNVGTDEANGFLITKDLTTGSVDIEYKPSLSDKTGAFSESIYSIELDSNELTVYRNEMNIEKKLFTKFDYTGNSIREIGINFRGNGKVLLAKVSYDDDKDGKYDKEMILTTPDKSVDWKILSQINNPPIIKVFEANKSNVEVGEEVTFRFEVADKDNDLLSCKLDVNGDGIYEYEKICDKLVPITYVYTYQKPGIYTAILKVIDSNYKTSKSYTIVVKDLQNPNDNNGNNNNDNKLKMFKLTTQKYSESEDLDRACKSEFGINWRLADWNDLKEFYNNGSNLEALLKYLGMKYYPDKLGGDAAWVSVNGQRFLNNSYHYFIARHDHETSFLCQYGGWPNGGCFAEYDQLDNHLISLGAWYGKERVLCFNDNFSINLDKGLVAYWSFDNCDATDDSGNGNNGQIIGDPECIYGIKGKAFKFDGLNDYIIIDKSSRDPNFNEVGEFTICFAMFSNDYENNEAGLLGKWWEYDKNGNLIDKRQYGIFLFKGKLYAYHSKTGYDWYKTKPYEVLNKKEYFVCQRIDEISNCLYVNGKKFDCISKENIPSFKDIPFWIGGYIYPERINNRRFHGILDEIRVYNRALNDNEIRALYQYVIGNTSSSTKQTILDTSFEEFSIGSLPNGFTIIYDGKGSSYQSVVNDKAYTGSKSFRVWGVSGWCSNVDYNFDVFNYKKVEVSWKMFTTENNNGGISFVNKDGDSWGWGWCGVGFSHKDGTYRICYTDDNGNNSCEYVGQDKIPVKVNDWNDIKIILNTQSTYCEAYLNGHKIYEATLNTETGWANYKYYFLDGTTKVYKYLYANPSAFSGIHGIRIGDCAGDNGSQSDPTYFDDIKIIGYNFYEN